MSAPILKPIHRQGTVGLITDQIREQIITGAFPPGTQLAESFLAQQLETSRGPVREALQRLVQEGLLESVHNRGVFVKRLTESDVKDIYLARTAIEKTAVAELIRAPRDELLEHLTGVVDAMRLVVSRRWSDIVELDMSFHRIVVDSVHSPRLTRIFDTLITETRMSLNMLDDFYPERHEIADEHQQLVDAIRIGDLPGLHEAIDAHMDHTARMRASVLGGIGQSTKSEQPQEKAVR